MLTVREVIALDVPLKEKADLIQEALGVARSAAYTWAELGRPCVECEVEATTSPGAVCRSCRSRLVGENSSCLCGRAKSPVALTCRACFAGVHADGFECKDCRRVLPEHEFRANRRNGADRAVTTFCRECEYQQLQKRNRLNPEKKRARTTVSMAVAQGRLVEGPCEVGDDCHGRIEAHHDDYARQLDVRWLCARHHHLHHVAERA